MNHMQAWLERAARELGIRIETGYRISAASSAELRAQAYFPDLGAPRGMLVFRSLHELAGEEGGLADMGYGVSVFDEPLPNEEFNLTDYQELFTDWGWVGDSAEKPVWML